MTTAAFSEGLISIVADLSRDLPAEQRYQRLLAALQQSFPCDAAALLQLDGDYLKPLAVDGLSVEAMGRRFRVDEHPRLDCLVHARVPVRFAADSPLPDPYDGLMNGDDPHLHVHDCMGASLYIDEQPWGVLTLDALNPATFDQIDSTELRTFIGLAEATVKAAARMDALTAHAERQQQVVRVLQEADQAPEMVGESAPMKRLQEEITIVARSHLNVLVLGETGVGKELVARQIHRLSGRAEQPLVYVNCAALPENLAESELFGHVKGAFSGALAARAGKFEVADGGTLFLDEVGELPLTLQATLLRALQSGEIQRVGSDRHLQVNVRIVAATNRDLADEVAEGRFRADLYHRLSVYPLQVPPLRERGQDILLLAGYLLEASQRRLDVHALRLSAEAGRQLQQYSWPGNVRELEHLLSRAALRARAGQVAGALAREASVVLAPEHLGLEQAAPVQASRAVRSPAKEGAVAAVALVAPDADALSMAQVLEHYQRQLISQRLTQCEGNRAAAARSLGVNRSNFHRLLKRLGLG